VTDFVSKSHPTQSTRSCTVAISQTTEKRKDGRLFHLSTPKKNFQSFAVMCRKPHVASSICLRTTIFQNPEWTLWTHYILNWVYNNTHALTGSVIYA
jgi:hypothetical protein